jgi:hypothetical protein
LFIDGVLLYLLLIPFWDFFGDLGFNFVLLFIVFLYLVINIKLSVYITFDVLLLLYCSLEVATIGVTLDKTGNVTNLHLLCYCT